MDSSSPSLYQDELAADLASAPMKGVLLVSEAFTEINAGLVLQSHQPPPQTQPCGTVSEIQMIWPRKSLMTTTATWSHILLRPVLPLTWRLLCRAGSLALHCSARGRSALQIWKCSADLEHSRTMVQSSHFSRACLWPMAETWTPLQHVDGYKGRRAGPPPSSKGT